MAIAEVSEKAQKQILCEGDSLGRDRHSGGPGRQSNDPLARGTQTREQSGSNVGITGWPETWPKDSCNLRVFQ